MTRSIPLDEFGEGANAVRDFSFVRSRGVCALLATILLVALLAPAYASPAPLVTWKQLNPLPQSNDLVRVAFAGDRFFAVGKYGTILTSSDGAEWQLCESGTEEPLGGIAWGNGVYVVVGGDNRGDGVILASDDGITWQQVHSEPGRQLSDVAFGDGRFVAVGGEWEGNGSGAETGRGALILTSTDGADWTPQDLGDALCGFRRVTYTGGQFIAAGSPGAIATSPDGLTWTMRDSGTGGGLPGVAYGNGIYVAVGHETDRGGLILTSQDGALWTERVVDPRYQFEDVTFAGDRFVVIGSGGGTASISETSTDGMSWAMSDTGTDLALLSLTSGKGEFMAVGQAGMILTSADGSKWEKRLDGTTAWLGDVAYGNGRFVIVGAQSTVLVSTDGETLAQGSVDSNWWLYRVSYADGQFVCIGSDGTSFSSFTSTDGAKWSDPHYITAYNGDSLTLMLRWRGQFVVFVRERGTAYASKDGIEWTELPGKVTLGRMGDATVVDDLLVACGALWAPKGVRTIEGTMGGFIVASADGVTWSLTHSDPYKYIFDLAYGGGKILAAAGSLWSTDGLNWAPVPGPGITGIHPSLFAYAGGWFLASGGTTILGDYGVLISRNGLQWTPVPPGRGRGLWQVAYGNGEFIGIDDNATVLSLTVPDITFLDIPTTDPTHEAVDLLAEHKVVAGFEDGLFHSERNVTRAEFAKMLVVTLGLAPDPAASLSFPDTPGHWSVAQGYLQAAVNAGAIAGYPDGTFRPDGVVTRAEAVKMVAAAASLEAQGTAPYPDVAPSDWFAGWVASAYEKGLIGPVCRFVVWPDRLQGDSLCTRAEAAMVLANLLVNQ